MARRRITTGMFAIASVMVLGVLPHAASAQSVPDAASADAGPLPPVSPTPQSISRAGRDATVTGRVLVVADDHTDAAARDRLIREMKKHGAARVDVVAPGEVPSSAAGLLTIRLGSAERPDIARALGDTAVSDHAEGYALRVSGQASHQQIALGGTDATGQFYAVQTLRQLFQRQGDDWQVAGAQASDYPSMPLRGTIEGFYGPPWTTAERLDHMDFLGDVKSNTYVYAPKDDPYHRDKWREPYPADKLAELSDLVGRARTNHVRFTFAVSPGASICYSDPADTKALTDKLRAMYDVGVRSFSIPLDDISYTRWNCAGDQEKFGSPGRGPAARAQVSLLNKVQRDFVAQLDGANPLQMVPTEYGDLTDTAYKETIRSTLDPAVQVMWTGTDVVPREITNAQASKAAELFGRKVFVWDNYPVNDFGRTAGRLLLAPYDKREPGLSDHLSGIVSNPMNQEAASKLAVFTMSDFSWNDRGYDRARSGRQAALHIAAGDPATADAVQVFVDLNHAAPTFGSELWQPQAPVFSARLDRFWQDHGTDARGAVREFRPYVRAVTRAPAVIRDGVPDKLFLSDASRWLDATELWGRAMEHGLDVLADIDAGNAAKAAEEREAMDSLADAASKITVDPAEHHQHGQVKIGDPFIEDFVTRVQDLHDESVGLPPLRELARGRTATQSSDYDWGGTFPFSADKSVDGDRFDFSTTSGKEAQPWWQVDLGASANLERIRIYNRTDCCAGRLKDYYVLVSDQPFSGTLADQLGKPGVWSHHETDQAGSPTTVETTARGRYVRVWLASASPVELNMAEVEVFGRVKEG
ncbi:beta-N-acetylglucosaminidase domain-containing protein [Streptomyces sp. NBC_01669]|uniref:beta-N-acetylglucosaminidase domain-containing protein n=1 Tax=Streptomyces sp. NBC_01669 TaxID=2975909 RepID=UPI00225A92EA|nr:beta-N-acetylglucosaminidase domain-containing protein [Streptomyces sp. NBC_01669]MCX4537580.1 beta-N-acetylglucosaminidase domain-containing protein [Streptomyces sp. NBC_01669]